MTDMKDKRSAEEKSISDVVDKAIEQHGPLATVAMLDRKLAEVRRVQRSGDYPKQMYGKDGVTVAVDSKADEEKLGKGWSDKPDDGHRDAIRVGSGAVVQTTEQVDAEAAMRRARYLADPADSTAHSALHGSGVVRTSDTTTDLPGLPLPLTATAVGGDQKPIVQPAPSAPLPPVAPLSVVLKGDK